MKNQIAKRGRNNNSDVHFIIRNVPADEVSTIVDTVVKGVKTTTPKSSISVITGPSHIMRKLDHISGSNQKRISKKDNGGARCESMC